MNTPHMAADSNTAPHDTASDVNFAYLDERTKRMIRRTILKAVAILATKCHLVLARCHCPMAGAQAVFK